MEAAILDYSRAIAISPDRPGAYYYRGLAQLAAKNFQVAQADFNTVLRLDPENADAKRKYDALRQKLKSPPPAVTPDPKPVKPSAQDPKPGPAGE